MMHTQGQARECWAIPRAVTTSVEAASRQRSRFPLGTDVELARLHLGRFAGHQPRGCRS